MSLQSSIAEIVLKGMIDVQGRNVPLVETEFLTSNPWLSLEGSYNDILMEKFGQMVAAGLEEYWAGNAQKSLEKVQIGDYLGHDIEKPATADMSAEIVYHVKLQNPLILECFALYAPAVCGSAVVFLATLLWPRLRTIWSRSIDQMVKQVTSKLGIKYWK